MKRRSNRSKWDLRPGEKEQILLGYAILPGDGFCGDVEREIQVVKRHLGSITAWSQQDPTGYLPDFGDPAPLGPNRMPAYWFKYRAPEQEAPPQEVRAVSFINCLKHTKGKWSGKPFNLRPWQAPPLRKLFGTLRDDGLRLFRRCLWEIARKNGKTEIAAAIALYMTIADGEEGAEVYSAAGDRDQAVLAWSVAKDMIEMSPRLSERCNIRESRYLIKDVPSRSEYRALPADAALRHGANAHCIIYDEVHVAKNRQLYDVFDTSFGGRDEPIFFLPTTSGHDRNSICWELHDEALAVLAGLIERPAFLPVIFAAAEDDDWRNEEVWSKANPALGDFRNMDEMREKFAEALDMPSRENRFRQLYLCQWTQQAERWLPMVKWRACNDPLRDLEGRECWVGVDLSSTTDLTAIAYAFPDDDGSFDVVMDFHLPEHDLKRRGEQDRVPYEQWRDAGFLLTNPGQVVDFDYASERVSERAERFNIQEIHYDPAKATTLVNKLEAEGFELKKFRQGFESMSPAAKHLERLLIQRRLRHGGNSILETHAANVAIKQDAGDNIKPVKPYTTARIDGIVALVMAIGGHLKAPPPEVNPYAERGIVFV